MNRAQLPPELAFSHPYDALAPHHMLKPRTTIPHRVPLTLFVGITCPTHTRASTRALWLLGTPLVVLIMLQLLSCGPVCDVLPVGRASYIDLREVFTEFRLFNQPQGGSRNAVKEAEPAPMLIPRTIHQTYRTRQLSPTLRAVRQSWARVNGPGWQLRFYDDEACIAFVRREFPEYLDAYLSLPKDVERSDFFRYMVILRLGGVYADIDVELRQPLDSVIGPTDTLVVGWEAEVATDAEAFKRHFVRNRQVLQWFFAAAPGHPVLRAACDHIARYSRHTFSNNTNRDTLERTGPGMWTDAVLRHAAAHPPTKANDPWKVRILPRVAFGVHPAGIDGLTPDAKEIVVLHHFLGSWKKRGGWHKRRSVLQILAGAFAAALRRRHEAVVAEEPITPSVLGLFPVSAAFNPPFTIMTHLIGQGDMQSGSDVSAHLTSWGTWQAAMSRPSRRPLVVEALVGSLGPPEQGAVLVDVSAGGGFFSLAAAARGHKVVAFETSARSIEAFTTSVIYNGFEDRIRLYNVSLGAAPSTLCLRERSADDMVRLDGGGSGGLQAAAAVAPAGAGAPTESNDAPAAAIRRGYGDPALHALSQAECAVMTVRQTLSHMLMGGAEASLTPASTSKSGPGASAADGGAPVAATVVTEGAAQAQAVGTDAAPAGGGQRHNGSWLVWDDSALPYQVGALRLSAHGWEGWILDGAEGWLARHRPGVVLLEYSPALVERSGYPGGGVRLLYRLYEMGYVHVAHTGYVCDERWLNISRALRAGGMPVGGEQLPGGHGGGGQGKGPGGGGGPPLTASGMTQLPRQPTWCKLKPDVFDLLTDRVHPEVAENVLFIHTTHQSVRGEQRSAEQGAPDAQAQSSTAPVSAAASSSRGGAGAADAEADADGAERAGGGSQATAGALLGSAGAPGSHVGARSGQAAAEGGAPGMGTTSRTMMRGGASSVHSSGETNVGGGRRWAAGSAQRTRGH
ncbi:hypothetical protein PLESTB_001477000 [Pleodorina starrii]|uniref:tRNA(Phe) (4-demethylwyosine(37)-C(7)) aminocarboxypropyltransferase n=1 Tax=Pleodorina starrii TaxID=330485 RepID=A0A9W6BX27_9CHLO|nr:hypothetical protein PLESTM_000648500 [Pleodorina starrii]GLC59350.1 hypothetical protein PLESTB_001477000 [Pleodorina starrii]GLC74451.1 hypothetical protein PLESTF_001514300 [Pleodorina starrii]